MSAAHFIIGYVLIGLGVGFVSAVIAKVMNGGRIGEEEAFGVVMIIIVWPFAVCFFGLFGFVRVLMRLINGDWQ